MGEWSSAGIVFADMTGLFRVSPDGGVPQRLSVQLGANEQALFPQFIPGRNAVLFTVVATRTLTPMGLANLPSARVDVLDLTNGSQRTILRGGGRAQYVPTGHLVYLVREALYAVPFDAGRLELRGERGLLAVPASDLIRLRYNPFFAYVLACVDAFLGGPKGSLRSCGIGTETR